MTRNLPWQTGESSSVSAKQQRKQPAEPSSSAAGPSSSRTNPVHSSQLPNSSQPSNPHKRTASTAQLPISLLSSDTSDDELHPRSAPKRLESRAPQRVRVQEFEDEEDAEDRAAADEVIDLTQQDPEGDDLPDCYGIVNSKIVGMQYYSGVVSGGEQVIIVREPSNQYDSNAIRVLNVRRHQVGHIPRQVAAKIASFIDRGSIRLEGVLTGNPTTYDCQLQLAIYGSSDEAVKATTKQSLKDARVPFRRDPAEIEAEQHAKEQERTRKVAERARQQEENRAAAAAKKAKKAAGGMGGPRGPANAPPDPSQSEFTGASSQLSANRAWENTVESSAQLNPRDLESVIEKFGKGEDELKKLPFAKQPEAMNTILLPYQLQGLAWMLKSEHPTAPEEKEEIVQMWKQHPTIAGLYQNIASSFSCKKADLEAKDGLSSGGILSDDMGLGKTIQLIALIMADPKLDKRIVPMLKVMDERVKTTLIIAPVSVMSNWTVQIERHVKTALQPKVYHYHGSSKDSKALKDYDVVITTYGTLTKDYNPKSKLAQSKGLFSVNWRRVILDEAHNIRNPKAACSLAAASLTAESRWCLTGTPIINNLKDLYSQVRFLRLSGGLSEYDIFNRMIIRPVVGMGESSVLQALMATLCLRRTKTMKFIDLKIPPLSEFVKTVEWNQKEMEKYDVLDYEAKGLLQKYTAERANRVSGRNSEYSFLLEILLRMRQACNHTILCGERLTGLMKFATENQGQKVELNLENKEKLQNLLQLAIDSQEECPVCIDTLNGPIITTCKHVFDRVCIERVIETQHKCPMCRAALPQVEGYIVEPRVTKDVNAAEENEEDGGSGSSKIDALMEILTAAKLRDPSTKTIVFSQWTKFLDLIEPHLKAQGFGYTRIDGTMNVKKRDTALTRLEDDPGGVVMLASLSVCSVGLNLVAANTIVLMDSWWAPAIEDQAVDRVNRLGQTRPTTVFRLVMEDSIEERVLLIQQKKRELVASAFKEKGNQRGQGKALRSLADIQTLLT